eukprot:scaffold2359_cov102-Cylindrotheca_fusiformis.AAC.6
MKMGVDTNQKHQDGDFSERWITIEDDSSDPPEDSDQETLTVETHDYCDLLSRNEVAAAKTVANVSDEQVLVYTSRQPGIVEQRHTLCSK